MAVKAIIEAEYAPLINLFGSTEEARYYLCGFFIEPHPKGGVCLVATDGHVLGAFRHEEAFCTEAVIVRLNKQMLQACKTDKGDRYGKRFLVIDGDDAKVIKAHDLDHAKEGGVEMLCAQGKVIVDGTYPDWRRVIPHDYSRSTLAPAINATLLKPFIEVAASAGIRGQNKNLAPLAIKSSCLAGACLVTTGRRDFFGIVMPLRDTYCETSVTPEWVRETMPELVVGPPMPEGMSMEEPDAANTNEDMEEAS